MIVRACQSFIALFLLVTCGTSHAVNDHKIQVVWDGFSYPGESNSTDRCDYKQHASCKILFSDDYSAQFLEKIEQIEDDKYRFVNYAAEEKGETLHLTIAVNLEWADYADQAEIVSLKEDALIGRYRLCYSLMLYRADAYRYMLENVVSKCMTKAINKRDARDINSFVDNFIRGRDSDKSINIENDWLAEAAQLLARRRAIHLPIGVGKIEIADDVFPGDGFKKERLRLFIAENMSFQMSRVFGKPVIPPTLSAKGQKALRFRDQSRNRSISIWPAAHILSLKILPFQQKTVETKKDLWDEYFFSIVSVSHETALSEKFLNDVGLYWSLKRQLFKMAKNQNDEHDLMESLAKKQFPIDNLERLCRDIAAQLVKPDKKWIDQYIYKSDPIAAGKGFDRLHKELIK